MRRSLSKLSHCSIGRPPTTPRASISSSFSTFSGGGGGGRGRGRGSDLPNFGFSLGKSEPDDSKPESSPPTPSGIGHGRGRGKPFPSSPILPSFSSFVDNPNPNPPAGRGRGGIGPFSPPPQPQQQQQQQQQQPPQRKPIFFAKEEETADSNSSSSDAPKPREDSNLPSSIISVLAGAGRGRPLQTASPVSEKPKEENRHLRVRQQKAAESGERASSPPPQRLSREDAVKKAVGILSRSDDGDVGGGRGMGGGYRGRGGRGAVRGRGGRGRGRGRGRGYRPRDEESGDSTLESGFYLGDNADGEKLAQKLGPETMNTLAEGFEEMSARVLPSPMDDAYVEALHTNMMIECEPEYLMGDFESNPDIDETPPIPLRDALEKMKPFLMAYEGIKNQEEWEEVIKETMETVPLMKEIVDYYSGPDRVTAKQQQQELERVAKTLPESAPNSVKRFTERAILSLQSNPGWGFDKKCQFMDKVVLEVSQHYK